MVVIMVVIIMVMVVIIMVTVMVGRWARIAPQTAKGR